MTKKVKVILSSVRTGRAGKSIADWVMKKSEEYDGDLDFELIDLKEVNLPFMDEPVPAMMSDEYVNEHTKKWSEMMKSADALVIVTPEYNHGYPPSLKNAFDFLYNEWKDMPVAFVGYGGGGATDSIRQMREIIAFLGMKALDDQVTIGQIWEAVDDEGNVKPETMRGDILNLFKQLEDAQ
jgi:NAD(P)H-dependent FMN reductase